MPLTTAIALLVIGLLLRAFFSGFETGLISVDRIRVRHSAEEEHNPRAKRLLRHLDNEDPLRIAVLIGAHLSLILAGFATATITGNILIAIAVLALPLIVVTELIPRSLFRKRPMRLMMSLFPLVLLFEYLFAVLLLPLVLLLKGLRIIAGIGQTSSSGVTEEDFLHLVDESAAAGTIEPDEQEMIHSILDLQSTQAKEIMVPRINIQALSENAGREKLIRLFTESGRTRIPIFRESIDRIIGVVNVYDVLQDDEPENDTIARFVKEVIHVPDSISVGDLLQQLKSSHQHFAIVTDEYGGTDGLITLEDTLEEIFGEIHDEHDQAFDMIRRVGPRAYVIDARSPLEDVSERIGVPLEDDEVETIGGWVMRAAGRIPDQGEKLKHAGFRITILEGGANQINKIRLDVLSDQAPGEIDAS